MNQFGFHTGLRLGVPGIVLSYLVCALLNATSDVQVKLGEVAVWGVFVGLIVTPLLERRTAEYFKRLTAARFGDEKIVGAIRAKLSAEISARVTNAQVYDAALAYYASRYNDAELYAFREPKTLGVMYYNLFLTFVLGLPLSAGVIAAEAYRSCNPVAPHCVSALVPGSVLFAFCMLGMTVTRREARQRFIRTLRQEVLFWQGKPRSVVAELEFYPEDSGMDDARAVAVQGGISRRAGIRERLSQRLRRQVEPSVRDGSVNLTPRRVLSRVRSGE